MAEAWRARFDHVDEISVAWRCRFRITGQSRNGALFVVAYLARALDVLLFCRIGKMREVATHQPPRRLAMSDAGFVIEVCDLLQSAKADGGPPG